MVTLGEAVKFIDAVGCCMLFPVDRVPLPSLYWVVTRRSPHAKLVWDKYSEMIWKWKDELPCRKRAYYAKYFRGRGTFISLKMLPHFLAMREAPLAPGDHERFYAEGRIRGDARVIWESLEEHGPLPTLELRHACKMDTKAGNVRFKRAMLDLQCLMAVVHFGAEQETAAWASGRFELTCRAFPNETAAARRISPDEARTMLAKKYLAWYPHAPAEQVARLFGWSKEEARTAAGTSRSKS
ncbi:MAG: crosslink repair DNA glycosylase YcaQ family protein [Candidatus Acidiferrales bacterium]